MISQILWNKSKVFPTSYSDDTFRLRRLDGSGNLVDSPGLVYDLTNDIGTAPKSSRNIGCEYQNHPLELEIQC